MMRCKVLGTIKSFIFIIQVVKALHYLQAELKVIHRDVKPSNILINRNGQVKICDFGISGNLVDSVAKTIDAGCKPYMAVSRLQSSKFSLLLCGAGFFPFLWLVYSWFQGFSDVDLSLLFSPSGSIRRAVIRVMISDLTSGVLVSPWYG